LIGLRNWIIGIGIIVGMVYSPRKIFLWGGGKEGGEERERERYGSTEEDPKDVEMRSEREQTQKRRGSREIKIHKKRRVKEERITKKRKKDRKGHEMREIRGSLKRMLCQNEEERDQSMEGYFIKASQEEVW
jgi:hypothetical protein